MPEATKARAVGFNHVAIEVGDIDEALEFYGRLFDFRLRGKSNAAAFIDLGDQFLALQKGRRQAPDDGRHFGLVVDRDRHFLDVSSDLQLNITGEKRPLFVPVVLRALAANMVSDAAIGIEIKSLDSLQQVFPLARFQ